MKRKYIPYRLIYEKYYGPIPKEPNGRTYEIHHIDGNHSNNDPLNLRAVTIQEHYDIHYSQGDFAACHLMMIQRMNKTPEEIKDMNRRAQLKLMEEGRHHFVGESNPSVVASRNKTHSWMGDTNPSVIAVRNKTHRWLGPEHNKKMINDGIHPFLGGEMQRRTQRELVENGTHHLLNQDNHRYGKEHGKYDHTIYTFIHMDGRVETCTQHDLRIKYDLSRTHLSGMIHGRRKSHKGWTLVK